MTDAERIREWLEPDGLGGFASGTVSGVRTRRYHALLLSATTPPTGRMALVNGFDAWVTTDRGSFALTSQLYSPGVRHPDGETRIDRFDPDPWPRWRYQIEDGTRIVQQVTAWHNKPVTAISFALEGRKRSCELVVRPFVSGRDYHALHHENPSFRFDAEVAGERVVWRPYAGAPPVVSLMNGSYRHDPKWYRNFLYQVERERGLDYLEDLAAPGEMHFDLSKGEAIWILTSDPEALGEAAAASLLAGIRGQEQRRRKSFPTRLHRAADAYIVRRREGATIVAGYPWFTDWGRDTFIAIRGLCLATGRLEEAESILLEWAGAVSEGMLPNRFPDHGEAPEYNSVDASLWYVIAVQDYARQARNARRENLALLHDACQAILEGYSGGTRYGIHADDDGLLACGEPGVQLTWMDAKVGDWVVTPRIGKPVEVQALWLNALAYASSISKQWKPLLERGERSFQERSWNEEGGYLFDVIDVDHVRGTWDAALRPNQILAVGGLPRTVLTDKRRARAVVDCVEKRLWTPLGLRSLAPDDSHYVPRYQGGVRERDGAYHQGTVWPWLAGPFIDAWVRVRGAKAKSKADALFVAPLLGALDAAGVGHLPEIADAEPPHDPRGCPFQAWSVGEVLRARVVVSKKSAAKRKTPGRRSQRPLPRSAFAS